MLSLFAPCCHVVSHSPVVLLVANTVDTLSAHRFPSVGFVLQLLRGFDNDRPQIDTAVANVRSLVGLYQFMLAEV